MKKLFFLFASLIFVSTGIFAQGYPTLTLAQARVDADGDKIVDTKGDTIVVKGVVFTPNFQTNNRAYYLWDGTAGVSTFKSGLTSPALNLGDSVVITGYVDQYRGLVEIVPLTDADVVVVKSGAALPAPQTLTIAQFKANPEEYECEFVLFTNLTKISGTWPASGSSVNLSFLSGQDTMVIRIDSDTEIDGSTEPTWPMAIQGVVTQFTSSSTVYGDGYQLQPRFLTDFMVNVPVELASFTSVVKGSNVVLNWKTITETNNKGFEIYRNGTMVKFVSGFGTTTEMKSYQFTDNGLANGTYSYKLVQIDLDGTNEVVGSTEVTVNSLPKEFALAQNFPNPFNPSTSVKFDLPVDSKITLQVYNMIGQVVATLADGNFSAGSHNINFNASGLTSGMYIYNLKALGIDGKIMNATRKMTLVK
ncbi:MAG: T9SS C-terminal target domain-containing protein [Ignavibacteriales bacterium]|nr:MAG: T9SS C-terminal target domain-containing protein [Ignavibacteriales bacterium]